MRDQATHVRGKTDSRPQTMIPASVRVALSSSPSTYTNDMKGTGASSVQPTKEDISMRTRATSERRPP